MVASHFVSGRRWKQEHFLEKAALEDRGQSVERGVQAKAFLEDDDNTKTINVHGSTPHPRKKIPFGNCRPMRQLNRTRRDIPGCEYPVGSMVLPSRQLVHSETILRLTTSSRARNRVRPRKIFPTLLGHSGIVPPGTRFGTRGDGTRNGWAATDYWRMKQVVVS